MGMFPESSRESILQDQIIPLVIFCEIELWELHRLLAVSNG